MIILALAALLAAAPFGFRGAAGANCGADADLTTLWTDLSASGTYYRMNETGAATTRVDSSGGTALNMFVNSANEAAISGVIGNGSAGFYFFNNGFGLYSGISSTFTFWGWVNITNTTPNNMRTLMHFGGNSADTWYVNYDGANNEMDFNVVTAATATVTATATTGNGFPGKGVWFFLRCTYKHNGGSAAGVLSISINNGTTVLATTPTANSNLQDTGSPAFVFFAYRTGGTQWCQAIVDEWGFCQRELTAAEQTALYNCGMGRALP